MQRELNLERGRAAILGGFAALALFAVAFVVFTVALFIGIGPLPFGRTGEPPTGVFVAIYGFVPAIVVFRAALPARSLGAGWLRSLLIAVAVVGAFVFSLGTGFLTLTAAAFALAPALVTLVASVGSGIDAGGILAVLIASIALVALAVLGLAILGSSGGLIVFAICSCGWIVMPVIAGLFVPRRDRQ